MDAFASLAGALSAAGVRFVVIGVWGANYYAPSGGAMFATLDRDLFLPPDAGNLLRTWRVCENAGFTLLSGGQPLDSPRDEAMARAVVDHRALTRASNLRGTDVDLSLVMTGLDFESVWEERRVFDVGGIQIPVARLSHIVASKSATGREKDRLFLEMHRQALEDLLAEDTDNRSG